MPRRVGRDDSFITLMAGPVGLGIPRWLPLVLLYFAVVFGLGSVETPFGQQAMLVAGAAGPGVIGLWDLFRRLVTTHYAWTNDAGGTMVSPASVLDRLTFRECGWYLPVLVLPLPLWFLGFLLSAAFARSWGLV